MIEDDGWSMNDGLWIGFERMSGISWKKENGENGFRAQIVPILYGSMWMPLVGNVIFMWYLHTHVSKNI